MSPPVKSRDQLIVECQGLVRSLAWQIHRKLPSCVDLEDLVSCGQIGLIEAARDFDPERANQFTTYCYHRIRGAIFDGLAKMNWFRRADYDRGLYPGALRRLDPREPLQTENPSEAPQIAIDGDPDNAVMVFRQARPGFEEGGVTGPERFAASPPDIVMRREMLEKLRELLESLPPQARSLIEGAYFEGLSLKDAGIRIGKSKAWASRLHVKTLNKLAQSFRICRMAD